MGDDLVIQKKWELYLLDFSVQEWHHMNRAKKSFLKNVKFEEIKAKKNYYDDYVSDEITMDITFKGISHEIKLDSLTNGGYLTFDFDHLDDVFQLKLKSEEKKEIENHFIDFYNDYVKSDISYVSEDSKLDKKILQKIVNKWYNDGFATWEYAGAPGEDGVFGGSFHYIDDLSYYGDGFRFVIDFGSADEGSALFDLSQRIKDAGYIVTAGEYYNEIILKPKN
jgi:hypothetical protein